MLTITVQSRELFNEATSEFLSLDGATLKLEHSLLSLSKWEEKWPVPFLGRAGMKDDRTTEQVIDYIRCMTIVPKDLPPEFFDNLPADDEEAIAELTRIKGIGRWSAEIYLLFAEGRPDIWPAGDLAVQEAVGRILQLGARPSEKQARDLAEPWRPHRGAAAIFSWHCYNMAVI